MRKCSSSPTRSTDRTGQASADICFNGGPGSASVWLHMGAVGPKRSCSSRTASCRPRRIAIGDNPEHLLDRSDLVFVDAIATGFPRRQHRTTKKFLGVKGDIEAFGEFVWLVRTRYDRWPSPCSFLGKAMERRAPPALPRILQAAACHSTASRCFRQPWISDAGMDQEQRHSLLTAGADLQHDRRLYHKRLAPDLMQDLAKTRQEVEHWATTDYPAALLKGDALAPEERQKIIDAYARYTGLDKKLIDNANLRIDVQRSRTNCCSIRNCGSGGWTDGLPEWTRKDCLTSAFTIRPAPQFFRPTPPYSTTTCALHLGYKVDMPYKVFAWDEPAFQKWDWGEADKGFPNTAPGLRAALVENPYLKVLVMEGYYDLATPYLAAN